MAGMLDEVATYLATQMAGFEEDTNLFKSKMPELVDVCMAIFAHPGRPSLIGFGVTDGVQYERPGLAVWTRGTAGDYDTPRDSAHTARQELAKVQGMTLSGTVYHMIIPQQSPGILERDKNDRVVMFFNCAVEKEPS